MRPWDSESTKFESFSIVDLLHATCGDVSCPFSSFLPPGLDCESLPKTGTSYYRARRRQAALIHQRESLKCPPKWVIRQFLSPHSRACCPSATILSGLKQCVAGALSASLGRRCPSLSDLLRPDQAATLSAPVPFWKLVLAGGGSGFASTCVLTPVELIKCRLQAQLNQPTTSQSYRGQSHCVVWGVRGGDAMPT